MNSSGPLSWKRVLDPSGLVGAAEAQKMDVSLVSGYRALFESIPYDQGRPEALWILAADTAAEQFKSLPRSGMGIVGSRAPENASVFRVDRCVEALKKRPQAGIGWVVSGFARGVDLAAHEAAVSRGVRTLAVLASGPDVPYPSGRGPLIEAILDSGGALITEFEPGVEPRPMHFLKRNRLISAFSHAVWVVEAAGRSGALNTAAWTVRMGKDLYATPATPEDPRYGGNLRLLEDGYARPYFGAGSLGASWLELATVDRRA